MEPDKPKVPLHVVIQRNKNVFNQRNINCRMFEQSVDRSSYKRLPLLFELRNNKYKYK